MDNQKELQLIEKIHEAVGGTLDFNELVQKVTAIFVNELGLQGGAIFRVDPERHLLQACAFTTRSNWDKLVRAIGVPFSSLTTPIDRPVNYMGKTISLGKPIQGTCLRDFVCPAVSPIVADAIQKLSQANYYLSSPIKYKGTIIGALLTGHKNRDFTDKEVTLMEIFTAQLGLAMGNVMAHERIIERYKESLRQGEKKVAKIPKIKFTLRITPEIEQYLTFKVANTKESKAEYVRKLLEELMEKDEGYKKLRGPQ